MSTPSAPASITERSSLPSPRSILNQLFSTTLSNLSTPVPADHSASTLSSSRVFATLATPTPAPPPCVPLAGQASLLNTVPDSESTPAQLLTATATTTTAGAAETVIPTTHNSYADSPTSKPPARALFLTLHALFPHVLLPALDTLDRGLVVRLVPSIPISTHPGDLSPESLDDDYTSAYPAHKLGTKIGRAGGNEPYYVRSSEVSRRWGKQQQQDEQWGVPVYEVRLRAWNCSCAAFAFSAFGVAGAGNEADGEEEEEEEGGDEGDGKWDDDDNDHDDQDRITDGDRRYLNKKRKGGGEGDDNMDGIDFGSVSNAEKGAGGVQSDGEAHPNPVYPFGGLRLERPGAPVPVCKHLLACFLAERCAPLVGCMEERAVGWKEKVGWAAGWV